MNEAIRSAWVGSSDWGGPSSFANGPLRRESVAARIPLTVSSRSSGSSDRNDSRRPTRSACLAGPSCGRAAG